MLERLEILQGELGPGPALGPTAFLPKVEELFPEKGPECLHVLAESGAQCHQAEDAVRSISASLQGC